MSSTAQSIRLCARYVLGLVSDVMDVGALQENRMLLHPAPTDVDQLIGDAVNGLRALATSHRCTIDAEVGKLGTAVLDPDRVRQVLVNLGNDCIRYSPADSRVELKVWVQRRCPGLGKAGKAEERIELVEGEERLRITVSDHGPGMTPEQMEELFRPYVLSTASESREYAGSGLGLAIAKRVVELMGGRIWVSSELGNGTRFDVDIPLLRTGKEATTERLKMDGLGSPKMGARSVSRRRSSGGVSAGSIPSISVMGSVTAVPGSPTPTDISTGMGEATLSPNLPVAGPRRILVTDDSSLNRKILVKMITRILGDRSGDADWIIDEAENGEEAVSRVAGLLASEERNYAIVFMDVVMPVLDGYEATRRIKGLLLEPLSSGSRDPVPVIITTANQVTGTPEAEAEWRESGADAAIGKPFGKTDIERVFDAFGVFAGKG